MSDPSSAPGRDEWTDPLGPTSGLGQPFRDDIASGNVWPEEDDDGYICQTWADTRAMLDMLDMVSKAVERSGRHERPRPTDVMWMSDPEAWAAAEDIPYLGEIQI